MAEKRQSRVGKFLFGEEAKAQAPAQEVEFIQFDQFTEDDAPADPEAQEILSAVNDGEGGIYMVKCLMAEQPGLDRQGLLGILRITQVNPDDVLADADARIGAVSAEVERVAGECNTVCDDARSQIGEMREVIGQLKDKIAALEKDIARKQTTGTALRVQGAAMVGEIEVLKKILRGE